MSDIITALLNLGQFSTTQRVRVDNKLQWPTNGPVLFEKNTQTGKIFGLVHIGDKSYTVALDDGTIQAVKAFEAAGLDINILCGNAELTIQNRREGKIWIQSTSCDVTYRFTIRIERAVVNSTTVDPVAGRSTTTSAQLMRTSLLVNQKPIWRGEHTKNFTLPNGFSTDSPAEWMQKYLSNDIFWQGIPTEDEKFYVIPPARWNVGKQELDFRFVKIAAAYTAFTTMCDITKAKNSVRSMYPAPTISFEGIWSDYEVRPVIQAPPRLTLPLPRIAPPPPKLG